MKVIALILAAALMAGCTTRTEHGPCIGIADEKDPALVYKLSAWNIFLAVVFVELIAPPIVVLVDSVQCPVAKKAEQPKR
jgi:hypothetical protein